MKKKIISTILTAAMITSLLAGCGSSASTPAQDTSAAQDTETEAEANADAKEDAQSGTEGSSEGSAAAETEVSDPITIKFWNGFTGSDGDQLVELVDRFNSENEYGITVDMDITSSLDEELSSAFAAGEGPALLLSSSAYRFTYGQYMQDISDIFDKTGLDKGDFIQSYLDYCSEDDSLYLVPFQIVSFYLYWNKDLFEAAGLDPEKGPETWDEYLDYAKKITDPSKNVYGSGLCYGYNYQMAHTIQRFGGLAVTKDSSGKWQANFDSNSGYADFVNTYKQLVDAGDNPLTDDTDSMMTAGQLGMTINGPWLTGGMDTAGINYGISTIPAGAAGNMNSCEVLGFSVTTAASDAEKLAAYRFIEWWNTMDANGACPALEWSVTNGYPAYMKSLMETDTYKSNEKVMSMTNTDTSAPSDFIVDASFPGINAIINDVLPQLVQPVLFDETEAEGALSECQKLADDVVAQYNN